MTREEKARRLLRQFIGQVSTLLAANPTMAHYAQSYRAVTALIEDAKSFMGPVRARRSRSGTGVIDVPDPHNPDGPWVHLKTLPYEQAIKYVQDKFGADDKGRIFIVGRIDSDEE